MLLLLLPVRSSLFQWPRLDLDLTCIIRADSIVEIRLLREQVFFSDRLQRIRQRRRRRGGAGSRRRRGSRASELDGWEGRMRRLDRLLCGVFSGGYWDGERFRR
jgi:hypothetical protein